MAFLHGFWPKSNFFLVPKNCLFLPTRRGEKFFPGGCPPLDPPPPWTPLGPPKMAKKCKNFEFSKFFLPQNTFFEVLSRKKAFWAKKFFRPPPYLMPPRPTGPLGGLRKIQAPGTRKNNNFEFSRNRSKIIENGRPHKKTAIKRGF